MPYKLNIIIEEDQDGFYAYCPELKGCQSQGDSLEEVKENIQKRRSQYRNIRAIALVHLAMRSNYLESSNHNYSAKLR